MHDMLCAQVSLMAEAFHEMLMHRYTSRMLTYLQEQQKKHEENEVKKQVTAEAKCTPCLVDISSSLSLLHVISDANELPWLTGNLSCSDDVRLLLRRSKKRSRKR